MGAADNNMESAPVILESVVWVKVLSPLYLSVFSFLIWGAMYLLTPVSSLYKFRIETWLIAAFLFSFFFLGLFLGARKVASSRVRLIIKPVAIDKWINLIVVGGLAGMFVRLADRLILRGASLSADFLANKEAVSQYDTSLFSFAGAFLGHLLFLIIPLLMLRRGAGLRRRRDILIISLPLLYGCLDLLIMGVRYPILMFIIISGVSYVSFRRARWNLPLTLFLAALGLGAIWGLGLAFWYRAVSMGVDPIQSMQTSAYAYFLPITEEMRVSLQNEFSALSFSGLEYGLIHMAQYYLHGLFEFFYAVENNVGGHLMGVYDFYLPLKFIWVALSIEPSIDGFIQEQMVRYGVYTSLVGPIFYDFGFWLGMLFCLFFGYLIGTITRNVRHGRLEYIPLYAISTAFLPFIFAVNLFVFLSGQYLIYLALIFCVFGKLKNLSIGGSHGQNDNKKIVSNHSV